MRRKQDKNIENKQREEETIPKKISYAEILELKKPDERKLFLRKTFLLIGLILFVLSIILFVFINTLVGLGLFLLSIWVISKYWTLQDHLLRESVYFHPKYQEFRETPTKKIQFFNFSFSRFIATVIMISLIIWNINTFGLELGHVGDTGHWWNLGALTWAYPLAIPLAILSLGLVGYIVIHPNLTIIYESENLYHIYEIRLFSPWLTEIPKNNIEAIRLHNSKNGPQWLYAVILFYIILLFKSGIALIEHPFQTNYIHSVHLIITASLTLLSIIILIAKQHCYFEIVTSDRLYEMWFDPALLHKRKMENIANFFCIEPIARDQHGFFDPLPKKSVNYDDQTRELLISTSRSYFRLCFGLFLIFIGIYSIFSYSLLGEFTAYTCLSYGFIVFFKGIKEDFSDKNNIIIEIDRENKQFKQKRIFSRILEYHFFNNLKSLQLHENTDKSPQYYPPKLDIFDIAGVIAIIFFIVQEYVYQIMVWAPKNIDFQNILVMLFELSIIITLIYLIIRPVDTINVGTKTIDNYIIQLPSLFRYSEKNGERNNFILSNVYKSKETKSFIKKRIILIIITISISAIIAVIDIFQFLP
ncbi:MAG: hypothetical protein GF364_05260 [Candidatus Lokiarchaeota archaeon]|nr:hypothetical protein [Candidatus Lokiarchaeota archaeon]